MMVSPFTFYRGAAKIMAADLKDTPRAGLNVQLCGDAHLSNFGAFASPERTLLFDLNDFDETLPGPFEYDVKRMAASFTIAARNNGFDKPVARESTVESVSAYRKAMAEFAEMRTLDIWYSRITEQDVMDAIAQATQVSKTKGDKRLAKNAAATVQKAHTHDSLQALSKLAERVDGQYRIVSQPPIVVPARDVEAAFGVSSEEICASFTNSSAPTGPRSKTTAGNCWNASRWSTSPARSWGSAASAHGHSWCCCRAAIRTTRCSCNSKKPPRRSWKTTCRRAGTDSPASVWCTANG